MAIQDRAFSVLVPPLYMRSVWVFQNTKNDMSHVGDPPDMIYIYMHTGGLAILLLLAVVLSTLKEGKSFRLPPALFSPVEMVVGEPFLSLPHAFGSIY